MTADPKHPVESAPDSVVAPGSPLWRLNPLVALQNVPDLINTRHHTYDFRGSRSEHIQTRLRILAMIFAILVAAWIPLDYLTLPLGDFAHLFWMRLALMTTYLFLAFWSGQKQSLETARFRLALLVLFPAIFYLGASTLLHGSNNEIVTSVYAFYPFIMVVQLAIFPLVLTEGLMLSVPIITAVLIAALVNGTFTSAILVNNLFLLVLLMVLTLWAQMSQIHMLLRLYRQATRDPLTGLFNRRMLMEHLENEIERARRYKRELSILMFDLDRFKRVNDTYGHLAGDSVLKCFAGILEEALRNADLGGRYGGEEFLAILPETGEAGAQNVAERIRTNSRNQTVIEPSAGEIKFTTSGGLAVLRADEDAVALLRRADELLYAAKAAGRDCIITDRVTD